MKKAKKTILSVLAVVMLVCVAAAIAGCGKDKSSYGHGEEGFYYYDGAGGARYFLSLQGGSFMMSTGGGDSFSGTYSYDADGGEISFSSGEGDFVAETAENSLSLVMRDSGYSFKAYRYFDVTYADVGGAVIKTVPVLNGQCAEPIEAERDGYYFIAWYEDPECLTEFAFDSAIAGDTAIYGWYIEKSEGATEYAVTLDYGDGTRDVLTTTGGAIYAGLPTEHDGREILGWWVSDVNDGGALTYKYRRGSGLSSDTVFFAVYSEDGGMGASVTKDGVTWERSVGTTVSVTIYDEDGNFMGSGSASSAAGICVPAALSSLGTGTYSVNVTSGSTTETLTYVVNALPRVSMSSAAVLSSGSGKVLSFSPVEGAEGYKITVTDGYRTETEDLGTRTFYNFSGWEMTEFGITFTVTAHADGFVDSVSDAFNCLLRLDRPEVYMDGDTVFWNAVDGALYYEVTVTGENGDAETYVTDALSLSLKYMNKGTYDISVLPVTEGYYSESSTVWQYAKDTLAAPEITDVSEYSVSWTRVEGATSYMVLINDTPYVASSAETLFLSDIPEGDGTYEISVKACGGSGDDSPYCDAVTATEMKFSSAVSYGGNTVGWNYDVAAAYYEISVNGGEGFYTVTEGNSREIELTRGGDNAIDVTAYDGKGEAIGSGRVTVYAYTVFLDGMGVVLDKSRVFVAVGDAICLEDVAPENATFVGWYTQADFTYGDSDEYSGKGTKVESGTIFTGSRDMYLYACWSYDYAPVSLYVGGELLSAEDVKYHSESYSLPVPDAADATDDFMGWYSGEDGTGVRFTDERGNAVREYDGTDALYAFCVQTREYSATTYDGRAVYSVSAHANVNLYGITEMTIPETYDGSFLVLGGSAFNNCSTLVTLNIPDTVVYISISNNGYRLGTGAFAGCSSLLDVNVYATGKNVAPTYFSCDGVLFHKTSDDGGVEMAYYPYARPLTSYVVPSYVCNEYEYRNDGTVHAVTTIPSQVFRDKKISSITISSTVRTVASQAFYNNLELKSVVFEPGGTAPLTIADDAFCLCSSLVEVTLPGRYADFNAKAFADCVALVNVYAEDGGTYSSNDGLLLDSAGKTIVYYPVGRTGEVVISDLSYGYVTGIGKGAFASNTKIVSVSLSSGVTLVGESAFEGCIGLETIEFGGDENSLDLVIESRAFYGCTLLSEVCLPVNLTALGADAFGGCTSLTTVSFNSRPSSGLDISAGAFGAGNNITTLKIGASVPEIDGIIEIFGGNSLTEVIVDEGNDSYLSDDCGVVYNKDGSTIIYYPSGRTGGYEVLDSASKIGAGAFAGNASLTYIKIGANVNTIEDGAFYGCSALTGIEIDGNNTNYASSEGVLYRKEDGAAVELLYCPENNSATSLTVPSSVSSVATYAFYNNKSVTEVIFVSQGDFTVGESAFYNASGLKNVALSGDIETIPSGAFYGCASLAYVALPSTVKKIEYRAFGECTSLVGDLTNQANGLGLPEGLVTIGDSAFYDCQKLAVTIPSTVETIGDSAFYGCWYSSSAKAPITFAAAEGDDAVALTIGDDAFRGARYATSVEIPARCVSVGERAFSGFGASVTSAAVSFAEGNGLTELPEEMFFEASTIESLVIPGMVTHIGAGAFGECAALASLSFSRDGETSSLEAIGDKAFYGAASLSSLILPSSLKEIGDGAFYKATLLTTLEIPTGVVSVGAEAFRESGISDLTFASPSSLETLGENAFRSCKMETVDVPASVSYMGRSVFNRCDSLVSVTFQGSGETSALTTLRDGTFAFCASLETVEFPENLEILGDGSTDGLFYGCESLRTVTVPASVKKIGPSAFSDCYSLSEVKFDDGSSLKEIGSYAFSFCLELTEFAFPESSAESIRLGDQIFADSGVLTVTLSKNVTDIGTAFSGIHLSVINVPAGHEYYSTSDDGKILYSVKDGAIACVVGYLEGAYVIPDGITVIGEYVFYNQSSLKSVTIPASVTEIGACAFENCKAMTEVKFEDGSSLTSVSEDTFSGCLALKSINLPDTVKEIGQRAFYQADLSDTTLPEGITYIDRYAFRATSLKEARLPFVEYIGKQAFQDSSSLTKVTLGEKLTEIGESTFAGCGSLAVCELPVYLTSMGDSAFSGCSALTSITIPDSLTVLEKETFSGCSSLLSVTLPKYLTEIGNSAFSGCSSLKSVVFPDTLRAIGTSCFSGCGIESAEFNDSLDSLGSRAFYGCANLKSVIIGSRVSTVGSDVFSGCTSLTEVYTGDSLADIGDRMFYGCTSLVSVEFGLGLRTIGAGAFENCSVLENLSFESGLESIGANAFSGCVSLKSLELPASLVSVGASAFSSCTCTLYVNDTEAYVEAYWQGWDTGFSGTIEYRV